MQDRILLIDNCEISRLGFDAIFKKQRFYSRYFISDQGKYIDDIKEYKPSILIINSICIPDESIQSILKNFYSFSNFRNPKTILISNTYYSDISNQINGYVNLSTCSKDIISCLESFKNNFNYTSDQFKMFHGSDFETKKIDIYEDFKNLTTKETSVLKLIVEGKSSVEISDTLFNSVRTIDAHRRKICDKFGLKGQGKLSLFVIENREFLKKIFQNNNLVNKLI